MAVAKTTAKHQVASSSNLASGYPNPPGTAQNLDLFQIIKNHGGTVLLNVDYLGTVHNPAVSPTNGTRIGVFQTNLTSSASTAQIFANVFVDMSQPDILQVANTGGNIHYYLDYFGVAHGS